MLNKQLFCGINCHQLNHPYICYKSHKKGVANNLTTPFII